MGVQAPGMGKKTSSTAKEKRRSTKVPIKRDKRAFFTLPVANTPVVKKKKTSGSRRSNKNDPIIIEDSEEEDPIIIEDSDEDPTGKTYDTHRSTIRLTQSAHPSSIDAHDFDQCRYAPSSETASSPLADPIQNLYRNTRGFTLMRNPPSTDFPHLQCSQEAAKNDHSFHIEIDKPIQPAPAPSPHLPFSGKHDADITRQSYPAPALIERTQDKESTTIFGRQPTGEASVLPFASGDKLCTGFTRPTTMRNLKRGKQFSRFKEDTPGPYKYRGHWKTSQPLKSGAEGSIHASSMQSDVEPNSTHTEPRLARSMSVMPIQSSIGKDLTLADISDLSLRHKVAHLMAVAPELPVRDLYELVIDMKGNFGDAKAEIFLRIQTQTPGPSVRPSNPCAERNVLDDRGEAMVKVDLDDPEIWNDNDVDTSTPPQPAPLGRKKKAEEVDKRRGKLAKKTWNMGKEAEVRRQPNGKGARNKDPAAKKCGPTAKATSIAPRSPISKAKPTKFTLPSNPQANIGVKRSRKRRSNSITGAFVISDDESWSDPDGSYKDADSVYATDIELGSQSDVQMDDVCADLGVAMQKPWLIESDGALDET